MKTQATTNRLFLIALLVYLFGGGLIMGVLPGPLTLYQQVLVSQFMIFLTPALFCATQVDGIVKFLHIRPIKIRTALLCVLSTLAIYPAMMLLNYISTLFVSSGTDELSGAMTDMSFGWNLLIIALLPALNEEFFCRGVLFRRYEKTSLRTAVLVSAFLFGCLHLNINQFVYTFLFGIFTAMVLIATDSLIATMICHFTLNSISVVAMEISKIIGETAETSAVQEIAEVVPQLAFLAYDETQVILTIYSMMVFAGGGIALLVLFFFLMLKVTGRKEEFLKVFEKTEARRKDTPRLLSPALVVAVVLCFADMILLEFL